MKTEQAGTLSMSEFVLDMGEENSYSSEAPRVCSQQYRSLKIWQLASSNWQLAKPKLRQSLKSTPD
jgi:hypothetical protein